MRRCEMTKITTVSLGDGSFEAAVGRHRLVIDAPASLGGSGRGPTSVELFATSLGSCVAIFVADRGDRSLEPVPPRGKGGLGPGGIGTPARPVSVERGPPLDQAPEAMLSLVAEPGGFGLGVGTERDAAGDIVLVLPGPGRPILGDDDVEVLVERVEAQFEAVERALHVHVPGARGPGLVPEVQDGGGRGPARAREGGGRRPPP